MSSLKTFSLKKNKEINIMLEKEASVENRATYYKTTTSLVRKSYFILRHYQGYLIYYQEVKGIPCE